MPEQLSLVEGLGEVPDNISRSAFDAWNEYARKNGWPEAQHNTAGRPAKLRRTVKDVGGLPAWRALLEKCGRSEFLCGKAKSGDRKPFVLTLDWILKPANLLKTMEGNYFRDNEPKPTTPTLSQQMAPEDRWARFLRDYRLRGFWPADLGPRPEDPACRAPKAMLEACRQRLGIQVEARPAETREQRLEASIALYRKHGRWADANRVEVELARLQGRPPVEVPAPDARDPDVLPKSDGFGQNRPDLAKSGQTRPPWNRPRADVVSQRIAARVGQVEPPAWTDEQIPESEYEIIEGEE